MYEPLGLKVNIVSREDQSFGYGKEVLVVKETLEMFGCTVSLCDVAKKPLYYIRHKQPHFDINIFIDQPSYFWTFAAKLNWLIPNPECFLHEWIDLLKNIDLVLCKNILSQKIFNNLSVKTAYTRFTSPDARRSTKKEKKVLHSRGKSPFKNTDLVFNTWCLNNNMPSLTLIESPQSIRQIPENTNITYIPAYLSQEELRHHQNSHIFHLCPSISEGFGHYINEAISISAITLTTNAPPMNELVTEDRGLLIDPEAEAPMRIGRCYYITEKALKLAIEKAFDMNDDEILKMGLNARKYYEESQAFFFKIFYNLLKDVKKTFY
jgi:hypothetical protein